MKKFSVIMALLICAFGFAACTKALAANESSSASTQISSETSEVIYTAKIVSVQNDSLMLAGIGDNAGESQVCRLSFKDLSLLDSQGNPLQQTDIKAGDLVEISYDGMMMESYPLQLSGPTSLRVTGEEPDLAGLYFQVLADLWKTDPALNEDISLLAFDMTNVNNMSPSEKAAFCWKAAEEYQCQLLVGTFDELCEEGYINKEEPYFKDGLLITLEDTPIENDQFRFDAQKWRSGRGAYFFYHCTATKGEGNSWKYTIGEEMIS